MYSDSVQLAKSYKTLKLWRMIHPEEYVRCCYHYGRLLRAQDDPVSAMQIFIGATHTRTREYIILGRVYSNMGSICHLASEFPLSYDMYERSAEMFLKQGDTTAYYYALNDMAYELAEQKRTEETHQILSEIQKQCIDNYVLAKAWETKATLYFNIGQFDSAIYCSDMLSHYAPMGSANYVVKAQSFDKSGRTDSAIYYAEYVLSLPTASMQERYNMLYITTHYNDTINNTELLEITSHRADLGMCLDHQHAEHAKASELLRQNLEKGNGMQRWLIMLTMVMLCTIVFLIPYLVKKHKRQISTLVDQQATNMIKSIKKHIDSADINKTIHWKEYDAMKTDVDLYMNGIVSKLERLHLNETEIRLCVLTLLDFPLKKIADTLCYSYPSGLKTLKKRTANKLGTTPPKMKDFLLHL